MPAAAQMGGDARPFVQNLHRGGRGTNLDQLMHQVVGDAVEVGIEGHVVVDVDAGAGPLAPIERLQGQRFPGWFVDHLE